MAMFERLLIVESIPSTNVDSILEKLRQTSFVADSVVCRELPGNLQMYDGVVLSVASFNLMEWIDRLEAVRKIPLFWLCPDSTDKSSSEFSPTRLDGLLSDEMNPDIMKWVLKLGCSNFEKRKQLISENVQLKNKLEERKVIDRAKEILAELKHISLTEAYQFLRTEAMKERRNIMEVSRSIVTAYQLIRSEKESKRR
jgi:response regulator NasT